MNTEYILLILIGFFVPPVPIFLLDKTIFSKEFLVSVLLTLLGHLPGVLFSIYYIVIEFPRRHRQRGYRNLDEENRNQPEHHESEEQQSQPSVYVGEQTQGSYNDIPEPVAGGSDAPPPNYSDVVTAEQQQQKLVDTKSADNKIQT